MQKPMRYDRITFDREEDGRWMAELPGMVIYGSTKEEAIANLQRELQQLLRDIARLVPIPSSFSHKA